MTDIKQPVIMVLTVIDVIQMRVVPSSAGVLVMSPTVKLEVGPPFNSFIHDYIFVCDCVFMYTIVHVEGLGRFICGS